MRQRLVFFIVATIALAFLDLAVKERLPTSEWLLHERSAAWVGLSVALLLGCFALAVLSSRTIAVLAAVTAGGALGNLISVRRYGAVPNPLLIGGSNGIVFNLADVFVTGGLLLLVIALIAASVRNQHRLLPPRRWEQRLANWVRR